MTTFPIALGQPDVPRRRYGQGTATFSATGVVRRALNATLAMVALVVALPLLAIIAIAVKLSSPGPVFYTQTRVGVNRRRLLPRGARYRAA
ncbi:MAG TPA: sugar transferase, partial [Gemmatimonadales bacterium]|nr:sugar transferase [Gemmatimonadales bacterium]